MKIQTARFGEIEIEENRIFNFVMPIIGFNELSKYVIIDPNKNGLFKWLQSIEDPALAFPVVSVFNLNSEYSIDLPDSVVEKLEISNVESLLVLNIASIPQDSPQETTINLLAPLIFNLDNNTAGQIILTGSGYNISYPLFKKN